MESPDAPLYDAADLAARIRAILTAPDTDLAKISAKRVRKQLERTGAAEVVRAHREQLDALIGDVFREVTEMDEGGGGEEEGDEEEAKAAVSPPETTAYGGEEEGEEEGDGDVAGEEEERPKKKKKKLEMTDEQLARQLSKELNGARPRATRGGPVNGSGSAKSRSNSGGAVGKKGARKGVKSAARIDSDGSESEDDNAPKRKRKSGGAGGGGAKGGFGKEYALR
jgi:upstream activation factor subunit UAF30